MHFDTRNRCAKCNRIIRGEIRLRNWLHYQPYCSYHCQETARMNRAMAALPNIRQNTSPTGVEETP